MVDLNTKAALYALGEYLERTGLDLLVFVAGTDGSECESISGNDSCIFFFCSI